MTWAMLVEISLGWAGQPKLVAHLPNLATFILNSVEQIPHLADISPNVVKTNRI